MTDVPDVSAATRRAQTADVATGNSPLAGIARRSGTLSPADADRLERELFGRRTSGQSVPPIAVTSCNPGVAEATNRRG